MNIDRPKGAPVQEKPKQFTGFTGKDALEADRRFTRILDQYAFDFLKKEDSEWFNERYTGNLTPEGYMERRDGEKSFDLPRNSVNSNFVHYPRLYAQAKKDFADRYPEESMKYEHEERKKIYEDPRVDPVVRETESVILAASNIQYGLKRLAPMDDPTYSLINASAERAAWMSFAAFYPEKANAYKETLPGLKRAMDKELDER
jgi:hypothetical protein